MGTFTFGVVGAGVALAGVGVGALFGSEVVAVGLVVVSVEASSSLLLFFLLHYRSCQTGPI